MNREILSGDALEKLKEIENESVDLICTDPPYGYSFMNKDWDKAVIGVDTWRECLRVLKPGSFAFVMSAPRQDVLSHMIVNLSDAGFNTGFTSMYWAYASGFPKAANISKLVDKKLGHKRDIKGWEVPHPDGSIRKSKTMPQPMSWKEDGSQGNGDLRPITEPISEQAKKLDGSYAGFQPKPAVEVILVCMKPLSEKNYVEQAMKDGKGVTWLDDCRVPFENNDKPEINRASFNVDENGCYISNDYWKYKSGTEYNASEKGRFPANLIVSDNSLDVGKKTKGSMHFMNSTIPQTIYGGGKGIPRKPHIGGFDDEGDFSRYFSLDSWEAQFIITPKPSKSEKNKGLTQYMNNIDKDEGRVPRTKNLSYVDDGRKTPIDNPYLRGKTPRQNTHPTVKPISLFKYLITMGSRPQDLVLDPFMGSGTTAIASEMLARRWIGIELNSEFIEIAQKRIDHYRNNRIDQWVSNC